MNASTKKRRTKRFSVVEAVRQLKELTQPHCLELVARLCGPPVGETSGRFEVKRRRPVRGGK